jgi:hypothetical protein
MAYYKFHQKEREMREGNYRTRHGVVLTQNNPPFEMHSASVVLSFPGNSEVKMTAGNRFAASRKKNFQLAETLISTLQGLLYGYHQVNYISLFSSSGSVGREEISIQMPMFGNSSLIRLKTYATANFVNENFRSQNISLALNAKVQTKAELALQLSIWKLICHTLQYHQTLSFGEKPIEAGVSSFKLGEMAFYRSDG